MSVRTALNLAFEAIAALICFSISWSTYSSTSHLDNVRPETVGMVVIFFIAGSIALFMLAQSLYKHLNRV
jgi:hypothetical protein